MKRAIVFASIMFLSSSVPAQQERVQTQPRAHLVYNLVSRLIEKCASSETTSQNNCNGYVYGVIDALDAGGLTCPGQPNPTYFGRRVKEDIAALGRNNSDKLSESAASLIASLLKSYGCRTPSDDYGAAHQSSSQPEAPDACRDVEAYKDKAPEDDSRYLQISWNTWMCETWANENGNQKLAHDSFNALDKLYDHESAALETQLWSNKKAPAVCKVFQDDQKAFHDAEMAGIASKLPETAILENADRAREEFRSAFAWNDEEGLKTMSDLSACAKWAWDSHQTVIAMEVVQFRSQLFEDPGIFPTDIEKVDPVCKNASSEANAILEFVYRHAADDRIMPSDVIAYYHRANPLAKCATQLSRTKYGNADNQLLWALFGINNLMVLADSNAQEKLIHALPPPQPGSPIVIKVQSSYRQNTNHCTGTVLNLGSISSVDWNCY